MAKLFGLYYSIEIIRLAAVVLITFTHIRHSFESGFMYVFLEQVPLYGTLILSIISGFLYAEVTSSKPDLLKKKVRSLLIPFLIANILVIIPAFIAHLYRLDLLNRLNFDWRIIYDGLFSISAAPVNPPTYFIRDIFVIFLMIEAIRTRSTLLAAGIILLALFGELLLRYDILALFVGGVLYSRYSKQIQTKKWVFVIGLIITGILLFYADMHFNRHFFSLALFILLIEWKVKFVNVGGYSYTLHLYHSPIIVVSYPLIHQYFENPYLLVFLQVGVAYSLSYIGYQIIKKLNLRLIIGGR